MAEQLEKNVRRFTGLAEVYDQARPIVPLYPVEVILRYLGRRPDQVVDLGCGTGLSTLIWAEVAGRVIGLEPNPEMLAIAEAKGGGKVSFARGQARATGLETAGTDVVVCSQSFHWMEPVSTLKEVDRILRPGGLFAAIDYDWPPLSLWPADRAFDGLNAKVRHIEATCPEISETFIRYPKENHLRNIKDSGRFSYVREVLFANREDCDTERFINLALSKGGLRTILKKRPDLVADDFQRFQETVRGCFPPEGLAIDFFYHLRLGLKEAEK